MKSRKEKDRKTLEAIGRIYCQGNHGGVTRDAAGLCVDCRAVIEATLHRTESCPFGHEGNCQDCPVKCQRGQAQERIREIMHYSAPRMAFIHPLMTAGYLRKKLQGKAVRRSGTE